MKPDYELSLYARVRDAIDAIRDLASALECDVARLQIYREQEALPRALTRTDQLAHELAVLEGTLRGCDVPCKPLSGPANAASPELPRTGRTEEVATPGQQATVS